MTFLLWTCVFSMQPTFTKQLLYARHYAKSRKGKRRERTDILIQASEDEFSRQKRTEGLADNRGFPGCMC